MSKAWAKGSTTRWRKIRRVVLRLDLPPALRPRCTIALPKCTTVATHVHHIHGKDSGCPGCKADQLDHLAPACAQCNLSTGAPSTPDPQPRPSTRW